MTPIARLLSVLSRDGLRALADTFDVAVADRRSAASLREGLVADALSLDDVLPELALPELRTACAALDVSPARSREDTVARLRAVLAAGSPTSSVRGSAPPPSAAPTLPPPVPTRRAFVALDFETADNGRDSACQIAAIRVEDGAIVARAVHYVRPPRRTFLHSGVHGITWDHVRREPTFAELWPRVAPIFDGAAFIAAHNAPFDRSVLNACCASAGLPAPRTPFVCTVQLARSTWSLRPTRLPDVCRHLGLSLRHHDAASDAEACARIVLAAGADRAHA